MTCSARRPGTGKIIVEYHVQVILMFSKNSTSPTVTQNSDYEEMLDTIKSFSRERLHFAKSKGIQKKQIVVDPGMGVFSAVLQNTALWSSGEIQNWMNLICLFYS